jgi:phosphotransferase system  glucose/maltose/N-acetylglucosamine-specific IIC component
MKHAKHPLQSAKPSFPTQINMKILRYFFGTLWVIFVWLMVAVIVGLVFVMVFPPHDMATRRECFSSFTMSMGMTRWERSFI